MQRENYKKLGQIADLTEYYGFDVLRITKLLDNHIYSRSEYCCRAMFDENGKIEQELLDELKKVKDREIISSCPEGNVLDKFMNN